jgi:YesN/AraC family two-component response regulator
MKHIKTQQEFNEHQENLNISDVISSINEDKDTNSLIKKLRQDLDKIRKEYEGKLTRNTIKDEFKEQIGKI